LIIPFGATGYVVFFEIRAAGRVHIGAIRHQRESDYH
jgi:plasmid stabilization system protein ParE